MDPSCSLGIARVGSSSAKATSLLPLLGHIINTLMSKLVRLTLSVIGLVPFCVSFDLDFLSVHKNAEKNLARISSLLDRTS